mgnify:FL=1
MFLECVNFNQPLNSWIISNNCKTKDMFEDCKLDKEFYPKFKQTY